MPGRKASTTGGGQMYLYRGDSGDDAAVGSRASLRSSSEAARRCAVPTLTRLRPYKRYVYFGILAQLALVASEEI